jgi:hypothetical protein
LNGLDLGAHVVAELSINQVESIFGEQLLGKILNSVESVLWLESGVLSDLVHKTLVFSLLAIEASHSTQLWDEVDELVVTVLLNHK